MIARIALSSYPARCGLAVLSGAAYALAYPPLGWGWLVVPGLAGLLVALHGQHGSRARTIGFLHGMAAYAVGLSWMAHIFGGLVLPLWAVLAAFPALFAEMQSRASQRGITGWRLALFTALNWCGWEFIRAELFPLKFPWMTAGLALGPNTLLPWVGVYGVSVLVAVAAALLAARKWKPATAVLLALVLTVTLSRRCPAPRTDDPLAVKIAGLQFEDVPLNEFLTGTRQLPADIPCVVWPEYALPYNLRKDEHDWPLVQTLCRERGLTLTLGTQSRPGNGAEWRNIALTLDPTGVRGEHNKVHTVHLFNDGLPGTTALPVPTEHGKIGTPICFDCDFEGVVRRMTAAGAEMFVVPSMDAAAWSARQHDQHAELFRIRACENARWMFVCATSGVSQVIDPHGHVHARLPALAQGSLIGTLRRESQLTYYTRFGWLVPWCVLVVAALCWTALLLPRGRGARIKTANQRKACRHEAILPERTLVRQGKILSADLAHHLNRVEKDYCHTLLNGGSRTGLGKHPTRKDRQSDTEAEIFLSPPIPESHPGKKRGGLRVACPALS
jgi:apolipoprotein N-acyltransferase